MKTKRILPVLFLISVLAISLPSCNRNNAGTDTLSDVTNQETSAPATNDFSGFVTDTPAATSAAVSVKYPSKIKFTFTQESVASLDASKYSKFSNCAEPSVLVPGLNQYMVPQGMDIWPDMNWLLISGYFSDTKFSKCSVVVAVDLASGKFIGEYFLKNADGTDHDSHAGGVAVTKKNLFISNAGYLYRIPLSSVLMAEQSGSITIAESISVPVNSSYCNYSGGVLWVGEFQYGKTYKTDDTHKMKNRDGDTYYAWTVGYLLDETTENEFKASAITSTYAIPDYILSITERIQGMTVISDNYIVLSQSYGRGNDSTLFIYNNPLSEKPHSQFTYNGLTIPVWFLDSKTGVKKLTAPPMTEGVAAIGGKLYVLFESGADTYRNGGGKNPTDRVWTVDVEKAVK